MKKGLIYNALLIILLMLMTGCGSTSEEAKENPLYQTKGKCPAIECIKQIQPEHTVKEINDIIGFEGELTDEKYHKYYWKLSDTSGVEVSYYLGNKGTIRIDLDRNLLGNNDITFSRYEELQPKVKDGINYSEFISYIGNVNGTIIEKDEKSTKYLWVSQNGSYITGSFSNSTQKCTFISGMIK